MAAFRSGCLFLLPLFSSHRLKIHPPYRIATNKANPAINTTTGTQNCISVNTLVVIPRPVIPRSVILAPLSTPYRKNDSPQAKRRTGGYHLSPTNTHQPRRHHH